MANRPKALVRAMKQLWKCADERGFSEDACTDLAVRIERLEAGSSVAGLEHAGLWRSAHSYMEKELQREKPDWPTVRALHRAWVESLRWAKAGAR